MEGEFGWLESRDGVASWEQRGGNWDFAKGCLLLGKRWSGAAHTVPHCPELSHSDTAMTALTCTQ